MVVRRIGALSLAKVSSVLYAILGFIAGVLLALISMLSGAVSDQPAGSVFGAIFGVGAVIFLPILYGLIGFVGSLIMAALYNWVAGMIGGVELEIEGGSMEPRRATNV